MYEDNDVFKIEEMEHLNAEISALKPFILEQLHVIKKSVEDIRAETVAPNNLEFIEALQEEIIYLRNKKLTKTSIIKIVTEKQAVETTLTPRIHQLDIQAHKELTPKTRSQEETISKNTNNGSKSVSHQTVYKYVSNDIAGNVNLQKSTLKKKNLAQKQKRK